MFCCRKNENSDVIKKNEVVARKVAEEKISRILGLDGCQLIDQPEGGKPALRIVFGIKWDGFTLNRHIETLKQAKITVKYKPPYMIDGNFWGADVPAQVLILDTIPQINEKIQKQPPRSDSLSVSL